MGRHSTATALPGPAMTLLRHCDGTARHCHGPATCCSGLATALPWHAMAPPLQRQPLPRHCHGTASHCHTLHGTTMTLARTAVAPACHCNSSAHTTALPWHCHETVTHCRGTAKHCHGAALAMPWYHGMDSTAMALP